MLGHFRISKGFAREYGDFHSVEYSTEIPIFPGEPFIDCHQKVGGSNGEKIRDASILVEYWCKKIYFSGQIVETFSCRTLKCLWC